MIALQRPVCDEASTALISLWSALPAITGVGLPILAAAGALVWIRPKRRSKAASKPGSSD